jgi:hypothetical protein
MPQSPFHPKAETTPLQTSASPISEVDLERAVQDDLNPITMREIRRQLHFRMNLTSRTV